LYDKLKNIPDNIKLKFDKLYPNVIDNVMNYVKLVKIEVSDESFDIIEDWWNQ
jgi:hypothetical protein